MKKISKGLSKILKVFLSFGILFVNLSSLSVVFAYENDEDDGFLVSINDENKVVIKYNLELENIDTLAIDEVFTYLDDTDVTNSEVKTISDIEELLVSDDGYVFESGILSTNTYDGVYKVTVTIGEEEKSATKEFESDSGIKYEVYKVGDTLLPLDDGKYVVPSDLDKVIVKARLLMGGINPTDTFIFNDVEYSLAQLVDGIDVEEIELAGFLYGEFSTSVVGVLNDAEYADDITVLYGDYKDDAMVLNNSASDLGLGNSYVFYSQTASGTLNMLTMSEDDVSSIVEGVALYDLVEKVSYKIEENNLVLSDLHGVTVTYSISEISAEYLEELIDQVIGNQPVDAEKSDINGDGKVNNDDVIYLDTALRNSDLLASVTDSTEIINSALEVSSDEIVSGDEFTVEYSLTLDQYPVNGISGTFEYDADVLKLISIEPVDFVGNNNDNKFLYVRDESLIGTKNEETLEDESIQITYDAVKYVVVKAKFRAMHAGSSTISITNIGNFNDGVRYTDASDVSTNVVVNTSDDNTLSSLKIAGQDIQLQADILEYAITVDNEVTSFDIMALLSNTAASISSIIAPEALSVGENEITIIVKAENGDEKVYTIIVTRKEAEKKEETVVSNVSYQETNNNNNNKVEEPPKNNEPDNKDDNKDKANDIKLSTIIVIILIVLVLAGLAFVIFKNDNKDEETKKTNKEINKFKSDDNYNKEVDRKDNKSKKTNKKGR